MRKNIKKLAAVGLTAVLGAGLLAGCGGDGKSSGGKTEITFGIWDENQRPAMEQMVEAYEKEHEGTPECACYNQLTTWSEYWTKLRHLQQAKRTGHHHTNVLLRGRIC